MKREQKKRDKVPRGYFNLVCAAIGQLNLLLPKLHKTVIEGLGYKFSLKCGSLA